VAVEDLKALSRTVPMLKPPRDYVPPENGILGWGDPLPAVGLGQPGLACLEPFNTFYVRRDLEVKPCCNALAPTHLGNVKKTAALDIWTGEGFEETRNQILQGQYPRMCHGCVKYGNAHALHHFTDDINEYGMWYTNVFEKDFRCDIRIFEALGSGPDVAARWRQPVEEETVEPEKTSFMQRIFRRSAERVR
jgi:hypothetical protein